MNAARNPFWVKCCECSHVWTAAYTPMELGKMAKLLKGLCCPMCGAGPKRILLALKTDVPA